MLNNNDDDENINNKLKEKVFFFQNCIFQGAICDYMLKYLCYNLSNKSAKNHCNLTILVQVSQTFF